MKIQTGNKPIDLPSHLLPANTVIELAPEIAQLAIEHGARPYKEAAKKPTKKKATSRVAETRETATKKDSE